MNVQDNVCLFVWSLFPKIRCLRDKNSLENIFGIKEDKGRIPNVMEIRTRKPSALQTFINQLSLQSILSLSNIGEDKNY